ncbi:MAG: DUF2341 domain-containing protein [Planctomycetes bacterium]|nr:DUF2341 domain-containing protein [Planctomycetota bacterium]
MCKKDKSLWAFFCLIFIFSILTFADIWQDTNTSDFSAGLVLGTSVVNDSVEIGLKTDWWDAAEGWWNVEIPGAAWWDTDWQYRRAVNINNAGASALSDYQVKVTNPVYDETGSAGSWHFEEGAGTTAMDMSGNCNNGTLTNGPAWSTSGKFGNALSFDGTNDYVDVSDSISQRPADKLTLEAWVYYADYAGSTYRHVIVKTISSGASPALNPYGLWINSGQNLIKFGIYTSGGWTEFGTDAIAYKNQWAHITATYDGSAMRIYVNGNEKTSTAKTGNIDYRTPGELYIGADDDDNNGTADYFWNGIIDEVHVYSRALSADEIASRYQSKAKLNYDDIRFCNSAGVELPHWMEKDGAFWVNVTGADSIPVGASAIYAYYGNSGAVSLSNGNNAFEFFDDFNSGFDANKWGVSGGAGSTVSGGKLNTQGTAEGMLYSKWYPASGKGVFEFKVGGTGYTAFSWVLGQQGGPTSNCILDIPLFMNSSYYYSGGWIGGAGHSAVTFATGDAFKISYEAGSPSWSVYKNTVLQYTATQTVNYPSLGIGFRTYSTNEYEIIDYLFVRKYAAVEPIASVDSEMPQNYGWQYRKQLIIDNKGSALSDYQVKIENPVWSEAGLMGSWHFEEAAGTISGTVDDMSGLHNDGTLNGFSNPSGITSAGKFGNAVSLDGTGDYIITSLDVQSSAMASTTWEAWVYPTRLNYASGRQQILTDDDGGYDRAVLIETGTSNFGVFTGSGCWQAASANLNQWQHIAVVFTSGNILFYKNGVQYSYGGAPSGQTSGNKLSIGWNQAVGEYFQGMIDEVRIYNRALSTGEIRSHYDAKVKPNYGDIRFTRNSGTELPYWMEKDGTFWVKISGTESIPAGLSRIYAYYGNLNAATAGNGAFVFEFFDDFNDGNLTGWSVDSGTWSAANRYAEGISNAANNFLRASGFVPPADYVAEYAGYSATGMDGGVAFRYQNSDNTYASICRNANNDSGIYQKNTAAWIQKSMSAFTLNDNFWVKNKFVMSGNAFTTSAAYYQSGTTVTAVNSWTDPSPAWTSGSFALYDYTTSSGRIDDVFVRKYTVTEPVVYAGYETNFSSAWTKRKQITLTNGGSVLSDYQLKVENPVFDETGLMGSWHFEEGVGTIYGTIADTSGQGRSGTLSNFASPNGIVTGGKAGNALSLDGSNDAVTAGNLGSFPAQGTIEFWINSSEIINYRNPLTTSNNGNAGIRFEEDTAGTFRVITGNDVGTCDYRDYFSSAIQPNTWYHIVYAWDSSANTEAGYLNGTQVFDGAHTLWPTSIPNFMIGVGFASSAERYWKGLIDEVRIYGRILLDTEIAAHYQAINPKSNYGDLRFANNAGLNLPYYMEKDGTFWVKVIGSNSIPAGQSDIYLYYNNISASNDGRQDYFTILPGTPVSAGKTYTKTPAPSGSYPDDGNAQLTNGLTRENLYSGTEATVGWDNIDPVVRIDLGSVYQIWQYKYYFGGGGAGGIKFPNQIAISASLDDVGFNPVVTGSGYADTEKWITLSSAPVSARYVKFTITRNTATPCWTMAGEFEVYEDISQPGAPAVAVGAVQDQYNTSGTFTSAVKDTGSDNTNINSVAWSASGAGTISMQVRASNVNSGWTDVSPVWEDVTTNPDSSIAATGRYIQYKATFTGSGASAEPVLADVAVTYTMPIVPPANSVLCDKLVNTWYSTSVFTFANTTGFGAQIDKYYYAWDNTSSHIFTLTESEWNSSTPQLQNSATSDGLWYFHYLPYSSTDTPGPAQNLGPFKYDNTSPAATALLLPSNNEFISSATASFSWSSVPDLSGVTYTLQIDNYPGFSSPIVNKAGIADAAYSLSGTGNEVLAGSSTYYWRVTAVDGAGNSMDSANRKFTTASTLPQILNESTGEAYTSIQDALDNAFDGDSLIVNDTVSYNENIIITNNVTLSSAVISPASGFAVTGQGIAGGEVLRNCVITSGGISSLALGENLTLYNPDPAETLVIQDSHLINCLIELGAEITNCTLENCDLEVTSAYFADAVAWDFHLTSAAVNAIDKGKNLSSEFMDDKDGTGRGVDVLDMDNFDSGSWDIGAYEFVLTSGYIDNNDGTGGDTGGSSDYSFILVEPGSLNFYSIGSSSALTQEFAVTGAGTFDFNWSLSEDMDWLSLNALSGSTTAAVNMQAAVDITGLAEGAYTGSITVTAPGAENSPLSISVTLTIESEEYALIAVNKTGLTFFADYGQADLVTEGLTISKNSGIDFNWTVSDNAAWLFVTPSSGTSQSPEDVSVIIDPSGLTAGVHTANITITALDAVNSPFTVSVGVVILESGSGSDSTQGGSTSGNTSADNSTGGGNTGGGAASVPTGIGMPSKPMPQSPANGMTDVFPAPVLGWAGTGASNTTYWLQLGEDADFNQMLVSKMMNATIYQTSGVQYGKVYYWRVKALNGSGESDWSDASWFQMKSGGEATNDSGKVSGCFLKRLTFRK